MIWPEIPLNKLLTYLDERIELQDMAEYITITVKRGHGGLEEREKLFGHQIKTKKQFRLIPGSFIISRVQCWHQAYAMVPDKLPSNMIASTNYDQFAISHDVNPRFFWWLSYSPTFTESVRSSASGVVIEKMVFNREAWLGKTIPLPPLPEQRRIVAKIDALAAKIAEGRKIQNDLEEEYNRLCRSIIFDKSYGGPVPTPMSELVSLKEPDVVVSPEQEYPFAGVYCFGRGVFIGERRKGFEFAYKKLTRLQAGNLVYPKLMAWEGAIGIVPPKCDGLLVSTEFPVFHVNVDSVLPEVLDVHFRTPSVWPLLAGASTGTNVRRRRLNPKNFLKYEFPLPSMENQIRLRQIYIKVNEIKELQTQTAAELDALLPAILDRAFKGEL